MTDNSPLYVLWFLLFRSCIVLKGWASVLTSRSYNIIFSDPHVTQPYVDIETWDDLSKQLNESELSESSVRTQSDACENPQDVSTDSTQPEHARNDSTEQDTPEIDSTEGKDDFADMPADKAMVGQLELVDREDKSFHVIRPGRIDINQLGT